MRNLLFRIAVVVCLLGNLCKFSVCQVPEGKLLDDKRSQQSLQLSYSNAYDKRVRLHSATIMSRNISTGIGGPNTFRNSWMGTSRGDLTSEALLNTPAHFVWWDWDLTHSDCPAPAPIDPSKRYSAALPYPEFDDAAQKWSFHFTLQPDNTWVGQFEGVTVKPIGADAKQHNASTLYPCQPWIHFQFRNDSGKQIHIPPRSGKLITAGSEARLFIPTPNADRVFRGYAAHCHQGSIFRPELLSKIVFSWRFYRDREDVPQEFVLPEFSDQEKNWYCYFVFGEDEKWTAIFEGTKEDTASGADRAKLGIEKK